MWIDGEEVACAADAAEGEEEGEEEGRVELCSLSPGEKWRVCGAQSWQVAERSLVSAGPARQAMQAPFAVVAGSQSGAGAEGERGRGGGGGGASDDRDGSGVTAASLLELAVFFANLHVQTSDASPAVVLDTDVEHALAAALADALEDADGAAGADAGADAGAVAGAAADAAAGRVESGVAGGAHLPNLVLIGGPRHNAATRRLAAFWRRVGHAASWSEGGALRLGACEYGGASVGAVLLGPTPGGGLALVVDGSDLRGLRDAIALGEPTIPPMARSVQSRTRPSTGGRPTRDACSAGRLRE